MGKGRLPQFGPRVRKLMLEAIRNGEHPVVEIAATIGISRNCANAWLLPIGGKRGVIRLLSMGVSMDDLVIRTYGNRPMPVEHVRELLGFANLNCVACGGDGLCPACSGAGVCPSCHGKGGSENDDGVAEAIDRLGWEEGKATLNQIKQLINERSN